MSMRAEHSSNPTIKIPTECHFLRCGLDVKVDQDDFGTDSGEQTVRGTEGVVIRLHEDTPLQIKDRVRDARGERSLIEAEAGGARRVVGRPYDAAWPIVTFRGNGGEIVDDFALVPHVVAGSKDVGAKVKQ